MLGKYYFILFLFLCQFSYGQDREDDAWVFFADKENVAESLSDPLLILTQEAIDRKELHGTIIDERDIPVTESYITEIKNAEGITVYAKSKWMNCVYVRGLIPDIDALLDFPFVLGIEFADKSLNTAPFFRNTPNKFFAETHSKIVYDYGSALNQIEQLNGQVLHENDLTGNEIPIAFLDSAFPDVNTILGFSNLISEGRLLGTYDFVLRQEDATGVGSHGTRTLSTSAGFIENEFVGTAPQASYYLFRTEDATSENPVEEAYWVEALERADSLGVYVVNTSLGYQDYDNANYDHAYEDLDGLTTFAARGANLALEKGMLVVTSAGNDGEGFGFVATPGDAIGAFTIGAVDADGEYVSFSSIGPTVDGRIKPDVMAQGREAANITTDGSILFSSGTSFSSPILAGLIACLWQTAPELTNAEIMQIVRESAHLFDTPTDEMGYGIPDFSEALLAVETLAIEELQQNELFAIYPNPVSDVLYINLPRNIDSASLAIYSILGTLVFETNISSEENTIFTDFLSEGMYIVQLKSSEKTQRFKLIKN